MSTLAHLALTAAIVIVALNVAAIVALVLLWLAEESYAADWDRAREDERAAMDAVLAEYEREWSA